MRYIYENDQGLIIIYTSLLKRQIIISDKPLSPVVQSLLEAAVSKGCIFASTQFVHVLELLLIYMPPSICYLLKRCQSLGFELNSGGSTHSTPNLKMYRILSGKQVLNILWSNGGLNSSD